jgi:biopolymer transport protein ExbD
MRFRFTNRQRAAGRIDMTPIIDCVFQLLLFFLVASRFEEESRSGVEGELPAQLPSAAEALPLTVKPREIIVNVNHAGQYVVSGQARSEAALIELFRQAATNNPGRQTVLIRGDERADWKYVARVMSLCNQERIKDYRVAVVPEAHRGP